MVHLWPVMKYTRKAAAPPCSTFRILGEEGAVTQRRKEFREREINIKRDVTI